VGDEEGDGHGDGEEEGGEAGEEAGNDEGGADDFREDGEDEAALGTEEAEGIGELGGHFGEALDFHKAVEEEHGEADPEAEGEEGEIDVPGEEVEVEEFHGAFGCLGCGWNFDERMCGMERRLVHLQGWEGDWTKGGGSCTEGDLAAICASLCQN